MFMIGIEIFSALAAVDIAQIPSSPISREEVTAALLGLKPPKRGRPLIAIIGINDATETTDYLMPYGILRRADVADVMLLATQPGAVKLFPALKVQPDAPISDFDTQYPDGADFVIVPAMSRDNDPVALEWIRNQADKGATIIGVCAGARVVAEAGLLDGKRATTHWYYLKGMLDRHPTIRYVANRRLVVDQAVVTTTGISASIPLTLTLIEAIAGREKAEAIAQNLGIEHWDISHNSAAFKMSPSFALTVLGNMLAVWNREQLGIELTPGIDEVSLALTADAWSRTYRSRALTFAASPEAVTSQSGARILPDHIAANWPSKRLVPVIGNRAPIEVFDNTLRAIKERYGARTAHVVAMQHEYPCN
ncbi:MAG: DJ-1/PfpI family protein [Anaerolineae bacterium]|nr:DJ-1/PfpI family protein [Anaerolineae bacterium]